jgi:hypothetical protein
MITLSNDKIKGGIKLPTKVDEITEEMLTQLTNQVEVGKNYALIALCYEVKFVDLMLTNKKQKATKVYVKVAKVNHDGSYLNLKAGDIVAVGQSAIEMGQHVYLNTMASENAVRAFLLDKARLSRPSATSFTTTDFEDYGQQSFLLMEFKVIPVVDIKAKFDYSIERIDPFEIK